MVSQRTFHEQYRSEDRQHKGSKHRNIRYAAAFRHHLRKQIYIFYIGPIRILPQSIGIICVAAVVVIILQCFYKFTKTGQSMTAAATSPKAAMMLGINVAKTRNLTFTISAILACVSAILISPMYNVYPDMGASVGTKGFCAAVIGGFGSIPAALVGGLLLGIIESLVSGVLSAAYRDIIAFVIMILILYLKPAGLLGKKVEQKF